SDVVKLKNVVLIDDIYTTGSTMDAAASCLKEAGVSEVYFAVLGVADKY
ncbi:MAG: ComF family protein, partial [Lachnospiraceae bacterium]|nr:ComF family protein [Lachnospiraceae bacterium]